MERVDRVLGIEDGRLANGGLVCAGRLTGLAECPA